MTGTTPPPDDREAFDAIVEGRTPRKSRHRMLIDGELTVDQLTLEECVRLRPADHAGRFSGAAPAFPRKIINAMQRRVREDGLDTLTAATPKMIEVLVGIATDEKAANPDRLRAVSMFMDRVYGKVADKLDVSVAAPAWEGVMSRIMVDDPLEVTNSPVVDAEVVE